MEQNQEQITSPFSLKQVGVVLINILVFVVYLFIVAFTCGFVPGLLSELGVIPKSYIQGEGFKNLAAGLSFVITVVGSIVLRKKIYFRLEKTTQASS